MSFEVGSKVGPYEIIERIGRGGMATVYKAYHEALDRNVALKVLHPTFQEDESFLRRFTREARVVAKLEHPNIVPIYDYAQHTGMPYLVMRYIEGETLKERMTMGALSQAEALRIARGIAAAIDYAHQTGVLHRDVKPSNVLLTRGGGVYMADFGLARIAQAGESTMSKDSMMGTPQYISPEQARGDREIDGRTDVYAFGIILYEIVTGQVPFQSDTTYSIIHSQIFDPPPLPTTIKEGISPGLELVLLKALQKDPGERYDSAGALFGAFQAALTASPATLGAAGSEPLPDYTPVAGTRLAAPGETKGDVPPLPDLTPAEPVVQDPPQDEVPPLPDLTPADLPGAAAVEAVAEEEAEPTPAKRRRRSLRWIGIGLLVVVCACLALSVLSSLDRMQQEGAAAVRTAATETAAAEDAAPRPPADSDRPPEDLINIPDRIRPTDELEALIAENPDDPQLKWELLAAYIRDGNQAEAEALGGELLAQPRRPITFHQLGERLFISGRIDVAVIVLEEGFRRYGDDRTIQRMLLTAYIFSEQAPERVQALLDALQELPHDGETVLLGEAYLAARDGRLEEALALLEELVPVADPGSVAEVLYLKGRLHLSLDQPEAALESFRAALDSRPPPWLVAAIEREIEALE